MIHANNLSKPLEDDGEEVDDEDGFIDVDGEDEDGFDEGDEAEDVVAALGLQEDDQAPGNGSPCGHLVLPRIHVPSA